MVILLEVAELDMTDNNTQCPSNLTQRIDSNKRTCAINSTSASCAPVIYLIDTIEYSKVCGKIKAYQFGTTDAFSLIAQVSIPTMWMVLVSLMEDQESISGPSLLPLMKLVVPLIMTVLVLTLIKQAV